MLITACRCPSCRLCYNYDVILNEVKDLPNSEMERAFTNVQNDRTQGLLRWQKTPPRSPSYRAERHNRCSLRLLRTQAGVKHNMGNDKVIKILCPS